MRTWDGKFRREVLENAGVSPINTNTTRILGYNTRRRIGGYSGAKYAAVLTALGADTICRHELPMQPCKAKLAPTNMPDTEMPKWKTRDATTKGWGHVMATVKNTYPGI